MILWLHIFCVLIININADSPYSFKVPGIARIGNKPANNIEGSSNKGTFNNLRVQNMINKRKIHQANLNRTRLIQQNILRKKLKLPMLRQNLRQKQGIPKYWQAELKGYVKDLIHRFGNVDLKTYTRPAIRAIENMHHVLITAIEVDEQGEVNIKYIPTNRNKRIRLKPVSQVPS